MNPLLIIAVVASFNVAFSKAEDSVQACETLMRCLTDVVAEKKRCDNISATIAGKWPPVYNDHQQSIAIKVAKVAEYDYTKRDEKIKCLKESMGNTTVISCDKTRKEQCANLTAAYTPRAKRQVVTGANTTTKAPTTKATPKTTTLSPAQIKAAADKAEAAAKKAADKALHDQLNKDLSDCQKVASALDTQCSGMASCCSENWLCDLKFQSTPGVFADTAKLNIDLQIERRAVSCPAPAPAPAPAPTPAVANVTASGR